MLCNRINFMNKTIAIIKSLKETDYYKSANLHIHTNQSDGKLSPQEVIETALNLGLKVISITDHNTVNAYNFINNYPNQLEVIKGVEFDCWHGYTLLHIIGYGIDVNYPDIKNICAKTKIGTELDLIRFLNTRKAKTVIRIIKDSGGVAVLAHPACCWNLNLFDMVKTLKEFGLDGMEVFYPYTGHRGLIKFYSLDYIKNIAIKLNLVVTGGTDCHGTDLRGR